VKRVSWLERLSPCLPGVPILPEISRYHPAPLNLNSKNRKNMKTDFSGYLGENLLIYG